MTQRVIHITTITLLMSFGCASSQIDVSDDHRFWGDYRIGDVYGTTQQLFLVSAEVYAICPPKYESSKIFPETVKEYQGDPGRWPRVVSVLDIGTRFRIDRFTVNPYGLGLPDIWATILGGPHDGLAVDVGFCRRMWVPVLGGNQMSTI